MLNIRKIHIKNYPNDNISFDFSFMDHLDKSDINIDILCPYLAGVIEGDGSIYYSKSKNKDVLKIEIAYNIHDYIPMIYLSKILQILNINSSHQKRKNSNLYILVITDVVSVHNTINLINGYFRTPKHDALSKLINYHNDCERLRNLYRLPIIEIKPLDNSYLKSNA